MGGVLLLLLLPLVLWAVTEVLEHWASTTYLWALGVMGVPALAAQDADRRTDSRTRRGRGVTATLRA